MKAQNPIKLVLSKWIFKLIIFIFGIYVIYYTLNLITFNNVQIIKDIFLLILSAFNKINPLFNIVIDKTLKYLIYPSLKFLWIPITIYVLICLISPSYIWRRFLSIVAICFLIILLKISVFKGFPFPNISFESLSVSEIKQILSYFQTILATSSSFIVYIFGIYLFVLWIFPPATWNLFSGAVLFLVGIIETMLPTQIIPYFGTVEFLTLSALFAYLFLFIHSLAGFIMVVTNSSLIGKFHQFIYNYAVNKFLTNKQDTTANGL